MAHRRADLIAHVGGAPSTVQRQLIERAVRLSLYLELLDGRMGEAGGLSDRDSRQYLAWSNAYGRVLRELGLKGADQRGPTLAEAMAAGRAKEPVAA